MSVLAPNYQPLDPRYLPEVAGVSNYPEGVKFVPCPGNDQPWGRFHVRPAFLALKPCKRKKIGGFDVHFWCSMCRFRGFACNDYWMNGGVTREEIVRRYGSGIAVDDNNCVFV